MGESRGRKSNEQTLVQTIVVLIRNTTWRCGKLEKSIVKHLYKRHESFGKPGVSVKEIGDGRCEGGKGDGERE